MTDVVDALLACARAPDSSRNELADLLAKVSNVEEAKAPIWRDSLTSYAAQHVRSVLVVLGYVSLVHPALTARILTSDFIGVLMENSSVQNESCVFAHALCEVVSQPELRPLIASHEPLCAWLGQQVRLSDEATSVCVDLVRLKMSITNDPKHSSPLTMDENESALIYDRLAAFVSAHAATPSEPLGPLQFDETRAAMSDALESLYYIVSWPALRERLSRDVNLLGVLSQRLGAPSKRALFPSRTAPHESSVYGGDPALSLPTSSSTYVIVSILSTMVGYPPTKSARQRGIDALRRSALKQTDLSTHEAMQPAAVAARARRLVDMDLVPPLVAVSAQTTTAAVREQLGTLFLALATEQDKKLRGRLLQQGVARALLRLCDTALAALNPESDESPRALEPVQALAKLSISTDPALMYGLGGAAERAVAYLSILFLAPPSSLLQVFEAGLALTNLASMSPSMSARIAHASYAPSQYEDVAHAIVPMFVQHDSLMLRRALVELLCNLLQDDGIFAYWAGEADENTASEETEGALQLQTAEGRLRLLLSLCDAPFEDEHGCALAMAAAGALATLASSAAACAHFSRMSPEALRPMAWLLEPPHVAPDVAQGLALRALTWLASLCEYAAWLTPRSQGTALQALLRSSGLIAATQSYVRTQVRAQDTAQLERMEALPVAASVLQHDARMT